MARASKTGGISMLWAQRQAERVLALWAVVVVLLGFLMLLGATPKEGGSVQWRDLLPFVGLAVAVLMAHLALTLGNFRGDAALLPLVALLAGFGLLAQDRMGVMESDGLMSLRALLPSAGILLMAMIGVALSRGRVALLAWPGWIWAFLAVGLVLTVLVTGRAFRGAVYATGMLTPTEALKLLVPLFLAWYLSRHQKALSKWGGPLALLPPLRTLWPLLAILVILILLLLVQRDLGMVLILSLVAVMMVLAGTRRPGYLAYAGILGAAGGYAFLQFFSHGQRRVEAWLDPFADPTGGGWQVLQGLSGMFAGGLWGEGFSEARPQYTPIAESDFVYAVIAEEFGFIGSLLLVVFFLVLIWRLLDIASRTKPPFAMLLATGIATAFAVQVFLNIGGVTKFIPLTGLTLPLISLGGSSLLVTFVALGLVLAISDGEAVRKRR